MMLLILYERLLEIDKSNIDAWIGISVCLERLEKYSDGLRASEKALEIQPNSYV